MTDKEKGGEHGELVEEAKEYCETSHYLAESAPRGTILKMIDAIEALTAERDATREGQDGWQALEGYKRQLGEIINDPYQGRSMGPRLSRTKRWWDEMKADRDALQERVDTLEEEIQEQRRLLLMNAPNALLEPKE